MIEPDCTGVAHRRPKHLPIRLERLDFQAGGIESREAPVLAGCVQRVRRRADGKMTRNRGLLVPGIEPVGLHTDGHIEIETDFHAKPRRKIAARPQAAGRGPLHEFNEFDFSRIGALTQFGAFGCIRLPPRFGPFPPRLVEAMPEHLEAGEPRSFRLALGTKLDEILPAFRRRVRREALERNRNARHFSLATPA